MGPETLSTQPKPKPKSGYRGGRPALCDSLLEVD
jgi:hypothetical protein